MIGRPSHDGACNTLGAHVVARDSTDGPATTSDDLRFRRLRLTNWKNFLEVDIPVHDRMFLVGANGSGKSNLLDAFRFLRDVASHVGGLATAVERRNGIDAIRCLAAPPDAAVGIEVEAESKNGGSRWRYGLSFDQGSEGWPRLRSEHVSRNGRTVVERPDSDDARDGTFMQQTHIEQVSKSEEFRCMAELFASVRYVHLVPEIVRDVKRWSASDPNPYGSRFLVEVAATENDERQRRIELLSKALMAVVPHLDAIRLTRDKQGVPHLVARFTHWRNAAPWQTEEYLSDGTLRLIGLLWSTMTAKGPLLLEEPELSLHPDAVRILLQALESARSDNDMQLFVSTHSSEFLQDSGIGLAETVLLISSDGNATEAVLASADEQNRTLYASGMSAGEIAFSSAPPPNASGLMLFTTEP